MAITTRAALALAARQSVRIVRTAAFSPGSLVWWALFAPSTVGNTAIGIVPVAGQTLGGAVHPSLVGFAGGAGVLTKASIGIGSSPLKVRLYDRLFVAGHYAASSNVALAAQPSFAARVPGTDYAQVELWVEFISLTAVSTTITITYQNENGTGSRVSTITMTPSVLGQIVRLPLQAGDKGVSKITNVQTDAAGNSINVMLVRALSEHITYNNGTGGHPVDGLATAFEIGFPTVYDTSALYMAVRPVLGGTTVLDATFEIASG